MSKVSLKDLRVGNVFPTREGGYVTVVEITNYANITVQHNDHWGHIAKCELGDLNKGAVKNPYFPRVHGVGYLGVGPYASSADGVHSLAYAVWSDMMRRVYGVNNIHRWRTYTNVSVCVTWHNFQTFAHWYCSHPDYGKNYYLDKDILYPGNRVYSPATCCMVPKVINNLFKNPYNTDTGWPTGCRLIRGKYQVYFENNYLGVYTSPLEASIVHSRAKANRIVRVANEWVYCIQENVYDAMLDYADHLNMYTLVDTDGTVLRNPELRHITEPAQELIKR